MFSIMLVRAILILMILETGAFGLAALLHAGVPIFGFTESRIPSEATVQAVIGLLLAVGAYGVWERRHWARRAALAVHLFGLAGALFGIAVTYPRDGRPQLDSYNAIRLAALLVVPALLLTSAAKRELNAQE